MIPNNFVIKTDNDVKCLSSIEKDTFKTLLDIAQKSPDHGNALMDILGEDVYQRTLSNALKIFPVKQD